MIRSSLLPLVSLLVSTGARAGEITVEPKPFVIEKSFTATALPDNGSLLVQVEPKSWAEFQITKLAAHGAKVRKGDVLVAFDSEDIDRKIADVRRSIRSGELGLAQAELDLKTLEQTAPHKLEALRRAATIAKEEHSYFTGIRRKATEEAADQQLKRKKEALENEREELKQLAAMYKEDDLTEETEEIILVRQKSAVEAAEFGLRMETLSHKRTREVSLPREAVTLAEAERDTAIALAKGELDVPRSIELKKIELEALKTAREREKQTLADLEHDRALFEHKAPADGWFYHGPIENGRWSANPELLKTLVSHGRPPVNRPFATFVPASAQVSLVAFLDESSARPLKPELSGSATLSGREEFDIPVKLSRLASVPGADGSYRADFSVSWPKDLTPAAGSSAKICVEAYRKDDAIVIPTKALTRTAKGWTVNVKLTNGTSEQRAVIRGRVSGEQTEILTGLEIGQVVVTP